MNTAEYIVKRLEEFGVNEFFGLPGDYNFKILDAIDNNPSTRWIGCTNELNAGYAADGYARVKGYGALVTTYGVGELSAINAIAGSMAENVPVVHIVGLPATSYIENKNLIHHNFQEVNYQNCINAYKQVTSATAFLTKDNAKLEIDRVLKTLAREKKPVYVAIPSDVAQMEISDKPASYDWISDSNVLEELSHKIAEKINNSHQPVIIGDALIKRFEALIEYREFAAKSGIPVSNFLMGTNLIDMESDNFIGGYFGQYSNPIAQKYIEGTDCLIAVGVIYSDINSFGQNLPYNINDHIAIYGNYTYFEGQKYENVKMSELLEAVTELVKTREFEIDRPNIGLELQESDKENLNSSYTYSRIQEFIKENDIIIAETGTIPVGMAQLKIPFGVDVQIQALWGSIGWATPAALGAGIAKPQARIILITGDGAHQCSALEIGTMLKWGLKPIIIVINNKGYTTERFLSDESKNYNDIIQMNYAKFARVFEGDVWATQTSNSEDFDKALKVTQIMNKMCYIEAITDTLDAPALIKDLTKNIKNQVDKTNIPVSNIKHISNNIHDIITSNNKKFEYETVVHKGFYENNEESEEN